ncbi:MAG: protein-glutamate O-methyltransferase CheR [Alphaproteobacteria bacterium]|nr:protein-glutamate O-methyltransferase CheR [Alphaproteobacteria bacterium]
MTSAALRKAEPIVEGEFHFTWDDFAAIASLLMEQTGISLPESKATLVYSRLAKRLRRLGLTSFLQYRQLLNSPAGADEGLALVSALTTNVTRFFREPHHFDHLRQTVLPALLESAKAGGRVRLWSAACSTGEEAYSIALTVLELCPNANTYDIRILATDIDPDVLKVGRAGQYRHASLEAVPDKLRQRWFEPCGEKPEWASIKQDVKALVSFRQLNLNGSWPFQGAFDAIFCRNVVIYFDEPTQAQLWQRLRDRLTSGGRLYVGHSERVDVPGFRPEGHTVYRLDGQAGGA